MTTLSSPKMLLTLGLAGMFALTGCQASADAPPATPVQSEPVEQSQPAVEGTNEAEIAEQDAVETFSLDDVAQHSTLDDCWIAVDGVVYDVSGFGPSHPGGASRIEQICGTDATDAFRGQHGTSGAPNSTLAGFEIGVLG